MSVNKTDLNKKVYRLIPFFILFFAIFFIVENINHRFWMNDFKVYYFAAKNFFSGKTVYNKLFSLGSGYYKYSPFALIFFAPFLLVTFFTAKILYFSIYTALLIYSLIFIYKLISQYIFLNHNIKQMNKIILLTFLVVMVHIYRELHLGNLNLILLLCFYISLSLLLKGKSYFSGILLGIIILFKPFFLIVYPLFLLRKKFKVLIVSISTILVGLFIPSIIVGVKNNMELLKNWTATMFHHNLGATSGQSIHTLQSILFPIYKAFGINNNKIYFISIILFTAVVFGLFFIFNLKMENNNKQISTMNFFFENMILIALIPNIVFTDTEHFLLSLPLTMFIIFFYTNSITNKKNILSYSIILIFLMYGGNWHDLWGKIISVWMNQHSFLGIGNILLIIFSIHTFSKLRLKLLENNSKDLM